MSDTIPRGLSLQYPTEPTPYSYCCTIAPTAATPATQYPPLPTPYDRIPAAVEEIGATLDGVGVVPSSCTARLTSATPDPSSRVTTKISPVESELMYKRPLASHARPTGRKQASGQEARLALETMSTAAVWLFASAVGKPAPLNWTKESL